MNSDKNRNHPFKRGRADPAEALPSDKVVMRDSGIEILGPLPWGTHICQFYESKRDLLDLLVPYFATGLKNNEFCMWLTSGTLSPAEAARALSAAVPGLPEYRRRGQIEILSCDRWFGKPGRFKVKEALAKCLRKGDWVRASSYDGIRVSSNLSWLEDRDRAAFLDYERAIDAVTGEYNALVVCAYPLSRCRLPDLTGILDAHEFALIRNHRAWSRVAGGRLRSEAALRESEAMYRAFFEEAHDPILLLEMVQGGEPVIREVNPVALKIFGYSRVEILGKPVSILNADPATAPVITAKNKGRGGVSFEVRHKRKDGSVFIADARGREIVLGGKLMAISVERDMTERIKAEEELRRTCADLKVEKKLLEEKNIAFREAMSAIEVEKNKLKDDVIVNVNKIVLPILKRIRLTGGAPREHLDLLEKSLQTLISSFGRRLTETSLRLTPKEIELSNMIKAGMTTKEIAGLLTISAQTIDKHRNNIRRKLGLANKGVNLVSFLQSL